MARARVGAKSRSWSFMDATSKNVAGRCGGINPYTLMARLGPARIGGSGPLKDKRVAQPTCSESRARSQDRFGDQARSWSVRIGILIRPPMAIVIGWD